MGDNQRLVIRVPEETVALLSELVRRHQYPDQATAVQAAIVAFIDARLTSAEQQAILEEAQRRQDVPLQQLTSNGSDPKKIITDAVADSLRDQRER